MGFCGKLAVVPAVLVAFIAIFFMTTKVPDGFSEPWKVRALLTACRVSDKLMKMLTWFGYREVDMVKHVAMMFMGETMNENDTFVHQVNSEMEGVPVRLYWPVNRAKDQPIPAVVFLHGGGWVIGSPASYSDVTYEISKQLNAFVVSVDYRLAPEHLFPAGFEDSFKVTKYFLQNAGQYNVDPNRIAIEGDSSGGNLAAAVVLRLRNEKVEPKLKLQVLVYPVLQGTDFFTPSFQYNKDGPLTTQVGEVFFWNIYLYDSEEYSPMKLLNNHTSPEYKKGLLKINMDRSFLPNDEIMKAYKPLDDNFGDEEFWSKNKNTYLNPYVCPLNAVNFDNLPNAYISTCQHDVLRDDGFFYAGVLRRAGIDVTHENQKVCFHGWMSMLDLESSVQMLDQIILFMSKNL